jgi:hypothetical protein
VAFEGHFAGKMPSHSSGPNHSPNLAQKHHQFPDPCNGVERNDGGHPNPSHLRVHQKSKKIINYFGISHFYFIGPVEGNVPLLLDSFQSSQRKIL